MDTIKYFLSKYCVNGFLERKENLPTLNAKRFHYGATNDELLIFSGLDDEGRASTG